MLNSKSPGAPPARKDRHKEHTKSLRFPAGDGLLGWFENYAETHGLSVNAALVLALREFRTRHDEGPDAGRVEELERQLVRLRDQIADLMEERTELLRRCSPLSAEFAAQDAEFAAKIADLSARMEPIIAELRESTVG